MRDTGKASETGASDGPDIERVVRLHADTVARVCALYFGRRPERDDAFQETFLRYVQSRKEFEDDEHCKAWLIRVAANACKDMLKRVSAKTAPTDRFDDDASQPWQSGVQESDRAAQLNEALRKLDEKHRLPLYLKYYEGYSAADIAKALGIPENTVYTNLARGRAKLKEVLS